jgi:hypothetical protein
MVGRPAAGRYPSELSFSPSAKNGQKEHFGLAVSDFSFQLFPEGVRKVMEGDGPASNARR